MHKFFRILIAVFTAFSISAQQSTQSFDLTGKLNSSFGFQFAEDGDGNIYLKHTIVGNGLNTLLLKYEDGVWQNLDFECESCISDIKNGPDGKIYVSTEGQGIYKLEDNQWVQVTDVGCYKFEFNSDGHIVMVNNDGVFKYNGSEILNGGFVNKPTIFSVQEMVIDHGDDLWMMISDKIYYHNFSNGWEQKNESSTPELLAVAPDGKVWLAEGYGGASYYENFQYNFNQLTNVVPSGLKPTAFDIGNDGVYWFGIQGDDQGVVRYDTKIKTNFAADKLTGAGLNITSLFTTESGDVWVAADYSNFVSVIKSPVDNDQDGFTTDVDCDDNDPLINPDAEEIPNNDIDENCDGEVVIIDLDKDGFNSDVDCNDENAFINPDAEEIPGNDVDENCDGIIEGETVDNDQDGFNSDVDCDDENPQINPDAEEIPNNDIDENCDGEVLIIDNDEDGFNSDVDCDDDNPQINPDAEEIVGNDVDENCDGIVEGEAVDNDQDGFNSDVDCDDENPQINPDAEEIPNNDIDENCDGEVLIVDNDEDGFNSDEDCDDDNPQINPDAEEIPDNGIDEDCDGQDLVTSSIEELQSITFNLSPNPAYDVINVTFDGTKEVKSIIISDLSGKVMMTDARTVLSENVTISVQNLPSGLYLLSVATTEGTSTSKFSVVK